MFRRVDAVLLALAGAMIAAILLTTCLQVFYRYVLNDSLAWAEELSRYMFVWATFIAAAVLVGRGEHYAMPELVDALPAAPRRFLGGLVSLLCMVFCALVVYYGSRWAWRLCDADIPVLELPQGVVYAILPISAAYMAVRLWRRGSEPNSPPPVMVGAAEVPATPPHPAQRAGP